MQSSVLSLGTCFVALGRSLAHSDRNLFAESCVRTVLARSVFDLPFHIGSISNILEQRQQLAIFQTLRGRLRTLVPSWELNELVNEIRD
jgi:hypothetical protein